MTKHRIKTIRYEYLEGRQDLEHREILNIGKHKCKLSIKSDSYDFQSHATLQIWREEDLKWSPVTSIHYSQMDTETGLIYHPKHVQTSAWRNERFFLDRENLIKRACEILF